MRSRYTQFLLPLTLLFGTAYAQGEWRCDCTTIVDSCNAQVSIADTWVDVSSTSQQCSRVDYFIDGMPFVSVVVGGQQRQDWIARSASPNVLVQSCQVCRDNAGAPGAASAPAGNDTPAVLAPLIETAPIYPPAAQARGLEGYVDVSFTVSPLGAVESPNVTGAQPQNVFDAAALAAVSRWRYPADAAREPRTLSTRIPFRLDDYILQLARARATTDAPTPAGGVRNNCLREQSLYNFGETVEIGLMNACQDPLIVFGCGEGTGEYLGRWVCVDSERQQNVLLRPRDARIGGLASVDTPQGQRNFTYTDNFYVSRAPNTQYWWLACYEGDMECRDNARQWTRSLDRQLASIDPQSRTALDVSRSY
jgi:TonB family protein